MPMPVPALTGCRSHPGKSEGGSFHLGSHKTDIHEHPRNDFVNPSPTSDGDLQEPHSYSASEPTCGILMRMFMWPFGFGALSSP